MKIISLFIVLLFLSCSCGDNPARPEDCVLYNMNKKSDDTLFVADVNLGSLPPCIGDMKYLSVVALTRVGIHTLPEEFFKLENLDFFVSFENPLDSIPDKFDRFPKLKHFLIGASNLKSIPSTIIRDNEIISLYFVDSPLDSLPEEIGNMSKLQSLLLNGTNISHFPPSIKNLKNSLKNLEFIDTKVTQPVLDSLKKWLPNTMFSYNF